MATSAPGSSGSISASALFELTPSLTGTLERLGQTKVVWPRQRLDSPRESQLCVVTEGLFIARQERWPGVGLAELLFPGDVVAGASSVQDGDTTPTISAVWAGRVVTLPSAVVDRLVETQAEAARRLLAALTVRLRRAYSRQLNLMRCDARGRLAAFLIDWCRATGTDRMLSNPNGGGLARSDLADLMGVNRATVRLSLEAFQRRGLVSLKTDWVVILDRYELERRALGAEQCMPAVAPNDARGFASAPLAASDDRRHGKRTA